MERWFSMGTIGGRARIIRIVEDFMVLVGARMRLFLFPFPTPAYRGKIAAGSGIPSGDPRTVGDPALFIKPATDHNVVHSCHCHLDR